MTLPRTARTRGRQRPRCEQPHGRRCHEKPWERVQDMFSTVGLRGMILGAGLAATGALHAQITPAVMLTGMVKDAVTHVGIEGAVVNYTPSLFD